MKFIKDWFENDISEQTFTIIAYVVFGLAVVLVTILMIYLHRS